MLLGQQVGKVGVDLERRDAQGEEDGQRGNDRQYRTRVAEQPDLSQMEDVGEMMHGHGQSLTEPGRPGPDGYRD
ncbi:hypothetical protein D3C85_1707830 [compost metagenome]